MIPKKIHYFWFGKGPKSELEKECISRFATYAPSAEIIEWNEDNFDISSHPYAKKAYLDKKWAFVSDYARLKVLYDEGGIYLDTDMYVLKDITSLFEHNAFIGKEDAMHISAGIIGATPSHPFIQAALEEYSRLTERTTIPRVLSDVYKNGSYDIKVYETNTFYPFDAETIKHFNKNNPPEHAITVHMWNYSWGNPTIKFLKKVGVHKTLVSATEKLGIKKTIKKIIGAE